MKYFTTIADVPSLDYLLAMGKKLQQNPLAYHQTGKGKTLGLLFFNPSLRTRLSTQKAAYNLGMNVITLNVNNEGWQLELEDGTVMNQGSQEHIKEAAAVLSQYCDIIGIRSFAKLENRQEDENETILKKFKQYASTPIVSLESATGHPLQAFADLLTLMDTNIKQPKVVLSWAPHPKALPHAVANSFCKWTLAAGYDLTITHPKGMELNPAITAGASIEHDQLKAFENADFIYTKNWSSYTDYGKVNTENSDWIITEEKLKSAQFMHCLPVRRNIVVTDEVLDGANSLTIKQAQNRTYAAQAVLLKLLTNEN